jgi:competence protein ComEC
MTFEPSSCPTSNLNNHSVVTVVIYEGSKMLIPGDNESPSWDELLGKKNFRDAIRGTEVLLAPHHGRKAGFSEALFEHIRPRLTIISDGPSGSTSATNLYAEKTEGWTVHRRRRGGTERRRCVTTRKDGVVVVDFDRNNGSGQRYIKVTID